MFDDVGGVVQHQIHHLRIVLVDLDRDAMRLGVGGNGACGESDREQGGGYIAKHQELSEVERTSILVIARSKATKQSILSLLGAMDCFAPLAMTVLTLMAGPAYSRFRSGTESGRRRP